MNKNTVFWVVVAALVVGFAGYVFYGPKQPAPSQQAVITPKANTQPLAANEGRVVLSVSDPTTGSLSGATAILVSINKVEVHSSARGWVTVSNALVQYDLLKLKASGAASLLADVNLAADTYDQIRLDISKVEVTTAQGVKEAKLPSNTLKIVGALVVKEGETSTAKLDFAADKSLHLTGKGEYILAPVVRLETRSGAKASIDAEGKVDVEGGVLHASQEVGMDLNGETQADFQVNGNLEIDDSGKIKLGGSGEQGPTPAPAPINVNVSIQGFKFVPAILNVKKGTTVVWTNRDAMVHTVTADSGETGPDSGLLAVGNTYSYTFNTVGTFHYHCSIHSSMTGTVLVTE